MIDFLALRIGDEVNWIDPDSDGPHKIVEIQTPTGRVESEQTMLILEDSLGNASEALACEIG